MDTKQCYYVKPNVPVFYLLCLSLQKMIPIRNGLALNLNFYDRLTLQAIFHFASGIRTVQLYVTQANHNFSLLYQLD